jgi:hypothetical protein
MRLYKRQSLNTVISHLEGVRKTVHDTAHEVEGKAQAKMSKHHKSGSHQVTLTRGDTDSFVNLEGPAPLSVEFGHFVGGYFGEKQKKLQRVNGLHIITGPAYSQGRKRK